MSVRCRVALALFSLTIGPAGWSAVNARQSGPPPGGPAAVPFDPEPTARLVRLDAVVTDKHGRPLLNLKAADFDVVENGVAQKIDAVEQPGAMRSDGAGEPPAPILSAEDEIREATLP